MIPKYAKYGTVSFSKMDTFSMFNTTFAIRLNGIDEPFFCFIKYHYPKE